MNNKKIGIITFHFSKNYGSALQCYALYKLLSLQGYNAEVIDYCPSYHTMVYNTFNSFTVYLENRNGRSIPFTLVKAIVKNIKGIFDIEKREKNKRFNRFVQENIKLSNHYTHVKDIKDSYDSYISGSDQIWNYKCVKDKEFGGCYDKAYFLAFANNKKKISYAASAQHGEIRLDLDDKVLDLLMDYDYISTREDALTDTIKRLGINKAVTVLDPTLILDRQYYEEVEAQLDLEENYILIYNLPGTNSELLKNIVKEMSIRTGLKIIDISPNPYSELDSNKVKKCGPAEFLAYIHKANYVLTDSFHAVAFSIIYNKQFNCVLRDGNDERIKNILSLSGLRDRLLLSSGNPVDSAPINYDLVFENMRQAKEDSLEFLRHSLEN